MSNEIGQKVNQTAIAVAHCRAIESALDQSLISDPYATKLLELAGVPFTELSLAEVTTNRLVNSVALRSHFIDSEIQNSDSPQAVCLGMGLDTRPWRLRGPKSRMWFGIDMPETIDFMVEGMSIAAPAVGSDVHLIAADLTENLWAEKLVDAGFNPQKPAIWILEGVTMYLTDSQNSELLRNTLVTVGFGPGSVDDSQTSEVSARAAKSGNKFRSIISDPDAWLAPDWQAVRTDSFAEYGRKLRRPLPYEEDPARPVSWLITARRV
jgi:methyltransferase (TIGR00027 family)